MRKTILTGFMLLCTMIVTGQPTDNNNKMSPFLRSLVQTGTHHRAAADKGQAIEVLAKLTDEADEADVLQRYQAELLGRVGNVLIVRLPLSHAASMAADADVVRLEAERMPRPMLDQVTSQIGADKVSTNDGQRLPQAYTGKGVVVGIVDSGFDFINPFFRDASGTTRILWAKDYLNGRQYSGAEAVTAAMHSSDAATMYHGTHVAGIAAGSRVLDADWLTPTAYVGVAPEADIAEGAINSEITTTGLSSATSLQAFADIFAYAESQGKPCVINYSLGDAMSFSASRQLEEEAIATLLQKPGRALVVAAGNAGGTLRLAHKTAAMAEGGAGVCFNDYESYGTYFGVELKIKQGQSVRLRYTDSGYELNKGEQTLTSKQLESQTPFALGSKHITPMLKEQTADGYDIVYLTAGTTTTFQTTERILITIQGEGDAWIYADPLCAQLQNVVQPANHALAAEGYSMAWPATMDEVISVGNVAHRFKVITMANKYAAQGGGQVTPTDLTEYESTKGEGYLARSSSAGPTLAGSMKPDVCAPGVNIISAQNYFINDDTYYSLAGWDMAALDTEYETWEGLSGYFHIMAQTGTSMSAPAVAGTIALWMQADPTLTTERIKDIIAHSCRQPDETLTYPNNQYGYGEIDAYRGLLYMLGLTGIQGLSQSQPRKAVIALDGKVLRISFEDGRPQQATVSIYATGGRLLMKTTDTTVNMAGMPSGVYAVQVSTGSKETTGSTLVRL